MSNRPPVNWTAFIVAASAFAVAAFFAGVDLFYAARAAEYFLR